MGAGAGTGCVFCSASKPSRSKAPRKDQAKAAPKTAPKNTLCGVDTSSPQIPTSKPKKAPQHAPHIAIVFPQLPQTQPQWPSVHISHFHFLIANTALVFIKVWRIS
jgi:hypothetical protein